MSDYEQGPKAKPDIKRDKHSDQEETKKHSTTYHKSSGGGSTKETRSFVQEDKSERLDINDE